VIPSPGIGTRACELLKASAVAANSCVADSSCIGVGIGDLSLGFSTRDPAEDDGGSCQGETSCAAIFEKTVIGAESCIGTDACRRTKAKTIHDFSCVGEQACLDSNIDFQTIGASTTGILPHGESCIGDLSCNNTDAIIGAQACVGNSSCEVTWASYIEDNSVSTYRSAPFLQSLLSCKLFLIFQSAVCWRSKLLPIISYR
jgi:hypothetical protein